MYMPLALLILPFSLVKISEHQRVVAARWGRETAFHESENELHGRSVHCQVSVLLSGHQVSVVQCFTCRNLSVCLDDKVTHLIKHVLRNVGGDIGRMLRQPLSDL